VYLKHERKENQSLQFSAVCCCLQLFLCAMDSTVSYFQFLIIYCSRWNASYSYR